MQDVLLPLFPLELVLLPGTRLPLHIFEDRYKEMIGIAVRENSEFGIVQASEKGISNVGCTATVEQVLNRYPDGRMDIMTLGGRRFEILFLDQEKSFLRGGVNYFDDDPGQTPATHQARLAVLAWFELLRRQQGLEHPAPESSDPQLSFIIAEHIPVLPFRQTLLGLRSEAERLKQLEEFLPTYIAGLKRSEHVKKVAPKNGHGFISMGQNENT